MMKIAKIAPLSLALTTLPLFAHHMAEDVVDEEVYAMIDDIVAETPHAELVVEDLGEGVTETTIHSPTIRSMEAMMDDGLLTYSSMLEGDVDVAFNFEDNGSVTLSVVQVR